MPVQDRITPQELRRRLEETSRELRRFVDEPHARNRMTVSQDGDHISVRIAPARTKPEND
jgi:hypothetical protein